MTKLNFYKLAVITLINYEQLDENNLVFSLVSLMAMLSADEKKRFGINKSILWSYDRNLLTMANRAEL